MWVLEPLHVSGDSDKFGRVWLPAGKTSLGRKDCVACVGNEGDKSISRKHAEVEVGLLEVWEMGDVRARPSIAVSDSSKFGTFYLRPPQGYAALLESAGEAGEDEEEEEEEEEEEDAGEEGDGAEGGEVHGESEYGGGAGVEKGAAKSSERVARIGEGMRTPRAAREGEEATSCAKGWGEADYVAVARQPAVSRPDRAENQPTPLREGDRVKFGVHRAVYELRWRPLVLCCSTVPAGDQEEVFAAARELTAHVVPEWGPACTHLVMPAGTAQVTSKALLALADGRPVVSPAWLQDAIEAIGPQGSRLPTTFPRYTVHLQSRYLGLDAPTQVRPHRDAFEDHHGTAPAGHHPGGGRGLGAGLAKGPSGAGLMFADDDDDDYGEGLGALASPPRSARSALLQDTIVIFYPAACYLETKGASRKQSMSLARRAGARSVVALDSPRQVARLCLELAREAGREAAGSESSEDLREAPRREDPAAAAAAKEGRTGAGRAPHAWGGRVAPRLLAIDGDVDSQEGWALECLGEKLGGVLAKAPWEVEGCSLRALFMAVLHNDAGCLEQRCIPLQGLVQLTGDAARDKFAPPSALGARRKRRSGEVFAGEGGDEAAGGVAPAAVAVPFVPPAAEAATPHPPPSRRVRRASADPAELADAPDSVEGFVPAGVGAESLAASDDLAASLRGGPLRALIHQKSVALSGPSAEEGEEEGEGGDMPEGWVARSRRAPGGFGAEDDVSADVEEVIPRGSAVAGRLSAEYVRRQQRQAAAQRGALAVVGLREMDAEEERRFLPPLPSGDGSGAAMGGGGEDLWEAENVPVTHVARLHDGRGDDDEGEGDVAGELRDCDEAELGKLAVAELKAHLKRCELPVSGAKAALVERLVQSCVQDAQGQIHPRPAQ